MISLQTLDNHQPVSIFGCSSCNLNTDTLPKFLESVCLWLYYFIISFFTHFKAYIVHWQIVHLTNSYKTQPKNIFWCFESDILSESRMRQIVNLIFPFFKVLHRAVILLHWQIISLILRHFKLYHNVSTYVLMVNSCRVQQVSTLKRFTNKKKCKSKCNLVFFLLGKVTYISTK